MKTHIDVVGIVRRGDEFLLGKKKIEKNPYPGRWHTLGGTIDDQDKALKLFEEGDYDNEYFHDQLKKQVLAQANIEIENIHNIVPRYKKEVRQAITADDSGEDARYIFLEYTCEYRNGLVKPDDSFEKWEWHQKEELRDIQLTPPSREMYVELGWDWLW